MTKKQQTFTVKKERLFQITLSDIIVILKIIGYILIFLALYYIFIYAKWIYVYITTPRSQNIGLFFTILVSLTFMFYIVSTGIKITLGKKYIFLIIVIIIILLYYNYTNIGFGFEFRRNLGLLITNIYESNSYEGIKFFTRNFYVLWIFVWIMAVFLTGDDS